MSVPVNVLSVMKEDAHLASFYRQSVTRDAAHVQAGRDASNLALAATAALLEAARLQEKAEDFNANECDDCCGEGVPELCEKCFPYFDRARIARRAALAACGVQP